MVSYSYPPRTCNGLMAAETTLPLSEIERWRHAIRGDVAANYHLDMGYALVKTGDIAAALSHFGHAMAGGEVPEAAFALQATRRLAGERAEVPQASPLGAVAFLDRMSSPGRGHEADIFLATADDLTATAQTLSALTRLRIVHGQLDVAETLLALAEKACPQETAVDLYRQAANVAVQNDHAGKSLVFLTKATRLAPTAPGLQLALGHAYSRLGEFQSALAVIRPLAVPGKTTEYYFLAHTLLCTGEGRESAEMFDQAIEMARRAGDQKTMAGALTWQGIAWQSAGELEKAAVCHEAAGAVETAKVVATSNLGLVRLAQGRLTEAEDLCRPGLDRPNNAWVTTNAALVASAQGKWQLADKLHAVAYAADRSQIWQQAWRRSWVRSELEAIYMRLGFSRPI